MAFFIFENNLTPFELFYISDMKSLINAKICSMDGILNSCYLLSIDSTSYIKNVVSVFGFSYACALQIVERE